MGHSVCPPSQLAARTTFCLCFCFCSYYGPLQPLKWLSGAWPEGRSPPRLSGYMLRLSARSSLSGLHVARFPGRGQARPLNPRALRPKVCKQACTFFFSASQPFDVPLFFDNDLRFSIFDTWLLIV